MKKNILILYTNYGTGHYMAAKAIEENLKKRYKNYNIEILDPLSYSRPIINRIFEKIGTSIATKFRNFRKKLYKRKMYKDYMKNSLFFKFCIQLFWTKKLKKKLLNFNPDIIISTQVGPTGLIAAKKNLFHIKLISVFTDYGIHRMYTVCHEFIDTFCVPTNKMKEDMIKIGIDKRKIEVTGIPVREKFTSTERQINKEEKPLFLFLCGGGLGYDNAFRYFEIMLNSKIDFNYIFISGKNNKLLNHTKKISKKYKKEGEVLGYVNNIDELLQKTTMIFGKPGGIMTSEALNLNIPICAIEPIPGQEINNAKFIMENGFGFYVKDIREFKYLLSKLENNEINLSQYSKNIKNHFEKFNFIEI